MAEIGWKSAASITGRLKPGKWALWITVAAVLAGGLFRYMQQPSFWLDEAFVAVSLRSPSFSTIFGRLEYAQYFPRIYLFAIALLRQVFGYQIWVLRLLPFLSFVIATLLWARLLAQRSCRLPALGLLSAAFLLGSTFWLDQSIALKQYTFDVFVALIPFLVTDGFLKQSLAGGKRRVLLSALVLPCLLSYTYPFALAARLGGWYLDHRRRAGWRVDITACLVLASTGGLALAAMWATDYRFNLIDRASYLAYWDSCILQSRLHHGASDSLQLLAGFLWGWQGRQPLVTAGMVPLQALGIYSVIRRWQLRTPDASDSRWGSRSLGSILLLTGMVLASTLLSYPICAGRVTLIAQIHTQVLALEGALCILSFWHTPKALALLYIFTAVVLFHSGREYVRFLRSGPAENIRPMLPIIRSGIAETILVHSCSIAQVRSLPDPLPIREVVLGTEVRPPTGQKILILWTHLGADYCREELKQLRENALSWQIVHEGTETGLALAEF